MLYATDYFERGTTFSMTDFLAGKHSTVYPNGPAGMYYYGDPAFPRPYQQQVGNFSPRLGFVVNPHGDGRDTIRAGIGILYNTPEAWFFQRLASNPPVVNEIDLTGTQNGTFSKPWRTIPAAIPSPAGTGAKERNIPTSTLWVVLPPNMKPTNITQWNVTYQKQLKGDWMASASYIGNKTSHLWLGYDMNAAPGGGIPISDIIDRRPLYRPARGWASSQPADCG